MNKQLMVFVLVALGLGFGAGYLASYMGDGPSSDTADSGMAENGADKQPLFWRNPMNPEITSPVFMQDEMGMDYLPVYAEEAESKQKEVLFWRNPMNPEITSPVFMQDEMGMDYLPVYAEGGKPDAVVGTVSIDPVTVQNIGVRTARVERKTLSRQLNALGHVDFNEERLARLHPKTSGWIGQLNINETGRKVDHDTILLSIYSPDLVAAQREYLVALENSERARSSEATQIKTSARRVLESARERLELFDVPAHQLQELEKQRKVKKQLHIHSPFSGSVMNIGVREGQYVSPKDELYLIADLTRIWVYVNVYEDELPWIRLGDKAEMRVRAAPGRLFTGKVSFIQPTLDGKTRTVRVRLEFDNPDLTLKPGMFANVILHADPRPEALVVPSEAIIRSGSREQLFIVREPGKFEPREVRLGFSSAGMTQILDGVSAGEEVVVSSQFLIDSESKLREATAKMLSRMKGGEPSAKTMSDEDHSNMTMDHSAHGQTSIPPATSGTDEAMPANMDHSDHSGMSTEGAVHDH
ncbi:MAG: efflux RND transporter periplasmic adaptor subunit [Gammaproteobacteria bacterium]|nr:efflux RND transporter periplasmic adaptor subunit [Gammaproteobacteria bacterium]